MRRLILACVVALSVSAYGHKEQENPSNSTVSQPENIQTSPDNASAPTSNDAASASNAKSVPFDISTIPVSTVPLGKFPYFSLPAGYEQNSPETLDFGHFLFWTGKGMQDVEGMVGRAFVLLGDASYSVYLSHMFIMAPIMALSASSNQQWCAPDLLIFAIFLAAIGLGLLVYRTMEMPYLAWTTRRALRVTEYQLRASLSY